MIAKKREFYIGLTMLISFTAVLGILFAPVYHGANGLSFLDNMFNSMSKGSAYYIPAMKVEADKLAGTTINLTLEVDKESQREILTRLLDQANASASTAGTEFTMTADLGQLLNACIMDSETMYNNDGASIVQKYQTNERVILFNWHQLLKKIEKGLTKEKLFKEAKAVALINQRAVETAYNYYKVEAKSVKDSAFMLIFALVFYVVYTLWFGFGIMYTFEGLGMQMEH